MLKSIYLENWKTHLKSKLDFKKGTNILLGTIGSGKSSIVDAICYALYGTFPTLSNKKVILDETIMFKPVKKDFFKIILELEYDQKIYSIEREVYLGSKANSAKVYLENKLIVGPKKTDVDNFIFKLLGIDYNLFVKVVYSQQNEIDYFLKIIPSKRKEQFDDLFGISHFDKIKVSTKEIDRKLVFEIDKIKSLLLQIEEQISNYNFDEILDKEKDFLLKVDNLLKKIKNQEEEIKSISLKVKLAKEIKENYEKINKELSLVLIKIEEKDKIFEKLNEKNILDINLEILEKEKENLKKLELDLKEKLDENKRQEINKKSIAEKILFYNNNLSLNLKKKENLEQSIIPLEISLNSLKVNKENLEKELFKLKEQKINLLSSIKEIEKSILELSKGISKCPVCDSLLTKEQVNHKLKHKNEILDKNNVALKENSLILIEKEKEKKTLLEKEDIFEKNKKLKEEINQIIKFIDENKNQIDIFKKELSNFKEPNNLNDLETQIINLKDIISLKEEFLENKEKKHFLLNKKTQLLNEIKTLNYNEDDFIKLLAKNENIEINLSSLKENYNIYVENLKSIQEKKEIFKKLKEKKETLSLKESNLCLKKQNLSYFLKAIENSQLQLRKVLIDNVNQVLSIIWPKVYPYKDYLSARLNAKNDYILEVLTQKNDWIRVEGLLSGGERACASLSIRIAISLALTKRLGILILDEPTHNLDEKTINSLSVILEEELPDLVDQIFIVTHDKKLLETLNANKYIIERDKENDSVSRINF